MVVERWRQIERLFHTAREKSVEERSHFLDEACSSDPTLRREVESLLASEDLASGFLESNESGGPAAIAGEPLPAGEPVGPYTIVELLGAGGMGQVYKAHDERLDRHVALKFLLRLATGDPSAQERFEREARAASALNHPNICTVHDVGEYKGRAFIVMELLEGQSLKERLDGKPLPIEEFSTVSRQVCAALETAHAKGIVHRDVKPANLFVTESGQVKILDFGLAKRGPESLCASGPAFSVGGGSGASSLTASGTIVGTLAYMSPEQAVGDDVDARSDIFSLGVVLYEMATGRTPFRGRTPAGIMGSILTESPPRPSAVNGAIPAGLDRVILRAIEKDPQARYPSVALLSADLERSVTAASSRMRRRVFVTAGLGAAGLAGLGYLARRSLFPPERKVLVAVMPFENAGGDPREAFFASGLHQEMISILNRLYPDRLGAIGRTSVQRFKSGGASIEQIARDLKVSYVVEGGVHRDGNKARITARLIRASDQARLWNATYTRDLGQILSAQTEIANAIAQEIERGLRPDAQVSAALARPLIPAAHEAYLRGDFAKALEVDPEYAAAYSGMAKSLYYPGLFGFRPPHDTFTRMMNAAAKALELDPTQASAHAYLALGKLHLQWNWSEAEEGFRRALRLDPSDPNTRHFYAHLLLWSGRRGESVRECDYALNVDPFDAGLISCLGFHYLQAGDENRAQKETLRGLAIEPDHFWGMLTIGWVYEQRRMYQEALAAFRKVKFNCGLKNSSIAHAFGSSGDRRMAQKILSEMQAGAGGGYVSPCDIAIIHMGLDDRDRAFESLTRAYEEHAGWLIFLGSDPRLKPLRGDARFDDLVKRMRFPNREA